LIWDFTKKFITACVSLVLFSFLGIFRSNCWLQKNIAWSLLYELGSEFIARFQRIIILPWFRFLFIFEHPLRDLGSCKLRSSFAYSWPYSSNLFINLLTLGHDAVIFVLILMGRLGVFNVYVFLSIVNNCFIELFEWSRSFLQMLVYNASP
jgi:hypothetical protein